MRCFTFRRFKILVMFNWGFSRIFVLFKDDSGFIQVERPESRGARQPATPAQRSHKKKSAYKVVSQKSIPVSRQFILIITHVNVKNRLSDGFMRESTCAKRR